MTSQASIFQNQLSDKQRASHAGKTFGVRFIYLESFVFDTAGSLSEDYDGGYWHYYTLSNGGFYMAPASSEKLFVRSGNGYEGTMSAGAFGITCCLYAYSLLSFNSNAAFSETCATHYHWLRAFIAEHDEVASILAATD